jgi:putative transposase
MPRRLRFASGGYVYHVLNRAVARERIFAKKRDYEAFEEVLVQAKQRVPMRLLAWSALPSHWHLVLWPRGDGHLSEFMRWMTVTHTHSLARGAS